MTKARAEEIIALLSTIVLILLWRAEAHWTIIAAATVKAIGDWVCVALMARVEGNILKAKLENLRLQNELEETRTQK